MNESLRLIAIWIIGAAPVAALIASMLSGLVASVIWRNIVRGIVIASAVSAIGLLIEFAQSQQTLEVPLLNWISIPGLSISFGWQIDGLSLMQVLLTSVVLLVVLESWPEQIPWRELMLAWFGVQLVVLASNLGQVLIGWTLSAWVSSELSRRTNSAAHRPVWLVQRVTDGELLIGIALLASELGGSLQFTSWSSEEIGKIRSEMIETISLWMLIGILGRCAQLPLTVWLEGESGFAARAGHSMAKLSDQMVGLWHVPDGHEVADRLQTDPRNRWHEPTETSTPMPVIAWWLSAAFLPIGVGLLLRLSPIFSLAEHTRLLCVAAGAFTMLLTSASAAAQNNWPNVIAQVAAGQCGLALLAIGHDPLNGAATGFFALISQSLLLAVLLSAKALRSRDAQRLLAAASLMLASGLWGRHAIVDLVWQQAWPAVVTNGVAQSVELDETSTGLLPLIVVLLCLSELLTGFALFRAWFLNQREPFTKTETQRDDRRSGLSLLKMWCVLAIVLFAGVWFGAVRNDTLLTVLGSNVLSPLREYQPGSSPNIASPFAGGTLFPLSAVGVVLAGWMYMRPSTWPAKVATSLGPFSRLSRNRFYWDDMYYLLVVQPLIQISRWLVWCDEVIWNRGRTALRRVFVRTINTSMEPLASGLTSVYAVATFGSVVVLAWTLMWLRSSL